VESTHVFETTSTPPKASTAPAPHTSSSSTRAAPFSWVSPSATLLHRPVVAVPAPASPSPHIGPPARRAQSMAGPHSASCSAARRSPHSGSGTAGIPCSLGRCPPSPPPTSLRRHSARRSASPGCGRGHWCPQRAWSSLANSSRRRVPARGSGRATCARARASPSPPRRARRARRALPQTASRPTGGGCAGARARRRSSAGRRREAHRHGRPDWCGGGAAGRPWMRWRPRSRSFDEKPGWSLRCRAEGSSCQLLAPRAAGGAAQS
jgi:hypothetical protein